MRQRKCSDESRGSAKSVEDVGFRYSWVLLFGVSGFLGQTRGLAFGLVISGSSHDGSDGISAGSLRHYR